jgi:drug/metabolite transporter (DMT)-like permease
MSDLPHRGLPAIALAALWMVGTLLSFVLMAIGGRELSADLATAEILFFRSAIALLLLGVLLGSGVAGHPVKVLRTGRTGLHVLRNVAHFGGQFGWFLGLAALPLAEVFALEFTLPVWTAILAALLLRERLTGTRVVAIALGFLGVLILLRPGAQAIDPAAVAVLLGAVSYGLSHTLTRVLAQSETRLAILFYMSLIQLPLGLLLALEGWVIPPADAWPWLAGIAVTGLTGHYCLTRALSLADATVVVPMDFLRLPLIALVGAVLYGESLDLYVAAGAGVMLLGNWLNLRAARSENPVVD